MKVTLTVLVLVAVVVTEASGLVQTGATTNSLLVSSCSELAASKIISESSVTSPAMKYNSKGNVESYVIQPGKGSAIIRQNIFSKAHNYYGVLGGGASFSSEVSATNTKDTSLIMTGTSTAEVCYSQDYAMIKSETFGMGIAKPGEDEYTFEVNGDQGTKSTILPVPVPVVMNKNELLDKELVVTFKQNSLEMEVPADFLHQEVNFNYGTHNNQPTFYGYDFSHDLVVDDTTCSSFMSFSHVN